MNAPTLRRLAAEHSTLRRTELPPHWFLPLSEHGVASDDLTQLDICLVGPHGTPYAAGVWKIYFKFPIDYPNSPPQAFFKTKIWHPNVEENTGSVCVDTLKRDWQSKLTIRDILITITCLLIHPNPDSALNSTAGHLLQEDYEAFARQARLRTSIHATTPPELREAARIAARHGEEEAAQVTPNPDQSLLERKIQSSPSHPPGRGTDVHGKIQAGAVVMEGREEENKPTPSPDRPHSSENFADRQVKRSPAELPCHAEDDESRHLFELQNVQCQIPNGVRENSKIRGIDQAADKDLRSENGPASKRHCALGFGDRSRSDATIENSGREGHQRGDPLLNGYARPQECEQCRLRAQSEQSINVSRDPEWDYEGFDERCFE